MKVRYTGTAAADVERILTYILERNPSAAATIAEAIDATIVRLSEHPYSAPASDEPNIRMAPARRYPYLVFYRVASDAVEIVRVLHAARRRPWQEAQYEEEAE